MEKIMMYLIGILIVGLFLFLGIAYLYEKGYLYWIVGGILMYYVCAFLWKKKKERDRERRWLEKERQRELEEQRQQEQIRLEEEERKKYIEENISSLEKKSERYEWLIEYIRLSNNNQWLPFVKDKLKETISYQKFDIKLDIERPKGILKAISADKNIITEVYSELFKQLKPYIKGLTFSNYHLLDVLNKEFSDLKGKYNFLSEDLNNLRQLLTLQENEILSQYNGKYPYADKKCFYNFKGLVVNTRTSRGEVYHDIDNGLSTEFYVFDKTIEYHNIYGIYTINIEDIFKTEVYNDSIVLLYYTSGSVANFYIAEKQNREYFTKLIAKLKQNLSKETATSQTSTENQDSLKIVNELLYEKTNGQLHDFQQETEILWWKIGKTDVWLRLGDWDNNHKLYFAFWSNSKNTQYDAYRYDNSTNKEFFSLYDTSSFDLATFVKMINGEPISIEKVNVLVNEILDFYNNKTLNQKTITHIINECNNIK
ncbi:MAG: hypothetical protein Q4C98_01890 [Capnocytophaga sp.]|nr:hypothetical protein [Capnocytophaga sp.]